MLRKIDCVMLHADDLDAAVSYYQTVFGLRLHWRAESQAGLGMLETDAEIVLYSGDALPPGASAHYLVDNVIGTIEQLTRQGCAILVEPFEIAIGQCAVISDPFGNTLSILDMTNGPLPEGLGLPTKDAEPNDP